ncbi:MAG: hypothetical protein IKM02_03000 [Clostridia bacterium]|nr:hypothetical protein [Clostridia bacterium]
MAKIYTRREVQRRKVNFQIFAGIYDFISIVLGIIVIIGCAILLSSLISWVLNDAPVTFASLWDIFTSAIIIPE